MDLTNTNTTDTNTQTPPPQQQPQPQSQPTKSSPFTNGSLKRFHPTTVAPPSTAVSYKECLKNHAASIGGHALDGCGEFMPSSSNNPTQPRSLTCAVCGCHRNFHRREPQEQFSNPNFISFYQSSSQPRGPSLSTSPSPGPSPVSSPSPPPISHHFPPSFHYHHQSSSAPHVLFALRNDHHHHSHHHPQQDKSLNFNFSLAEKKKRYRTKFSQEQKEKMQRFSEKLGWRMHKGDEGLVQEFCNEIGVSRGVFKVWMHNNKNNFRKRSSEEEAAASGAERISNANGNDGHTNNDNDNSHAYHINSSNNDIHRD